MDQVLRWGIAGSGKICSDLCTALKGKPENHKVVCVAARSQESARLFAKKFNIPYAYNSYKQLTQHQDIDLIYVGVINTGHYDLCLCFLENGKGVLCEKPMTLTYKQTHHLVQVARKMNVFFMEGYWTRFFPAYTRMLAEIDSGTIGEVKTINVNFGLQIMQNERIQNLSLGGGTLLDLGCYAIQLVCSIFQEYPENISAHGKLYHTGVDEYETIHLQFSNDRFAVLVVHGGLMLKNTANIYGNKGKMELMEFWHPDALVVGEKKIDFPMPPSPGTMNYEYSEGLIYEAEEIRKTIKAGAKECSTMPLEHSLHIIRIMDEVRRQLKMVYPCDRL